VETGTDNRGRRQPFHLFAAALLGFFVVAGQATLSAQETDERLKAFSTDLEERFLEPAGWVWGTFVNADGAQIRYGRATPTVGAAATVVLVPGAGEFGEKYFEAARDLLSRGFAVWQMDWRGQGGSERYYDDPQRRGAAGYDRDAADLHQFVTEIVRPARDRPVILVAHSKGGHIGLRYLHDHPATFDFAAMTAPMLNINTGGIPRSVVKGLAASGDAVGLGRRYAPGMGPWAPEPETVDDSDVSQDPVRYAVARTWQIQNEELRIGGVTYGWLANAFRSIKLLNDEAYLAAIDTPVLMVTAGQDEVVDIPAQVRACGLMPACRQVPIPGAKHEIWMERDEYRNLWLAALDKFVVERLAPR
jgi:lysophospholipase